MSAFVDFICNNNHWKVVLLVSYLLFKTSNLGCARQASTVSNTFLFSLLAILIGISLERTRPKIIKSLNGSVQKPGNRHTNSFRIIFFRDLDIKSANVWAKTGSKLIKQIKNKVETENSPDFTLFLPFLWNLRANMAATSVTSFLLADRWPQINTHRKPLAKDVIDFEY